MTDDTKLFISWSGEYTKQVALVLRTWLEELFDNVKPFVSDRDIDPGARSMRVIEAELADTSFGIVVVTKENQGATWLNFEAGALSKVVGDSVNRVVPLLMDMDSPAELTGPISQFQAQKFDEAGMARIVEGIATVLGVNADAVKRRFGRSWQDILAEVEGIPAAIDAHQTARRPIPDMVEETLTIVRALEKRLAGTYETHSSHGLIPSTSPSEARLERLRAVKANLERVMDHDGIPGRVAFTRSGTGATVLEVQLHGPQPDQSMYVRDYISTMPTDVQELIMVQATPF